MTNLRNTTAAPDANGPHRRRPRYAGKHPRQFHEKYKELRPDRYPAEQQKLVDAGKTPAGTHRPICVQEILRVLNPRPGETGVDVTLGYGGHAQTLLERLGPTGRLIGLDVDPIELPKTERRLRLLGWAETNLVVVRSNYAGLPRVLGRAGVTHADFVLADLGLSSMQIDDPQRGFTFKWDGPLDLRMNPTRGQPASEWLQKVAVPELAAVLRDYADEPMAEAIAQALDAARQRGPVRTTRALAQHIRHAVATRSGTAAGAEADRTVQRAFQAIRIAVNEEFSALETFLRVLPLCLKPGGRVAVLTFHSGEDRRVKKSFLAGRQAGIYGDIAEDVIRPSADECRSNPRAKSAKLRWAIRAPAPVSSTDPAVA